VSSVVDSDAGCHAMDRHELRAREIGERRRETLEEKPEQSGSVPQILRDGAKPHIHSRYDVSPTYPRHHSVSDSKQHQLPINNIVMGHVMAAAPRHRRPLYILRINNIIMIL
jgi:hypothetical protein